MAASGYVTFGFQRSASLSGASRPIAPDDGYIRSIHDDNYLNGERQTADHSAGDFSLR